MTPELTVLALAALLQVAQFAAMAIPVNIELGPKTTSSPRDGLDLAAMVSPKTARLVRALNNHFEALILFTIATLVVTLGNQSTPITQYAAYTYLAARILYVPSYYFGWQPWRSLIWGTGFAATVIMLLSSLI
jgi:uncharacterized MAPEG superfamily protein